MHFLLFSLCLLCFCGISEGVVHDELKNTKIAFTADFIMTSKNDGFEGFYNGTMFYSYDGSKDFSYRSMSFHGYADQELPVEKYVCAYYGSDQSDKVYMRLNSCGIDCYYQRLFNDKGIMYECDYLFKAGEEYLDTDKSFVSNLGFDGNNVLTDFDTPYNHFEITNYQVINNYNWNVGPNYFDSSCVVKTCDIKMKFVFSIDASGSMGDKLNNGMSRMTAAKKMVERILDQFNMNLDHTEQTSVSALLIRWASFGQVYHFDHDESFSPAREPKYFFEHPFLTDFSQFQIDLNRLASNGGTCLGCGVKAAIEMSFVGAVYDFKNNPVEATKIGRVGFIFTDGEPTYYSNTTFSLLNATSKYNWDISYAKETLNNRYKTSSDKRYRYYWDPDPTKAFHFKDWDYDVLISNAVEWFGDNKLIEEINFLDIFTLVILSAYEAAKDSNAMSYYQAISLRSKTLPQSFSNIHTVEDLANDEEMSFFYSQLKADICSAFSGEKDNCALGEPCCNNKPNFCPFITDKCKQTFGYYNGDQMKCIYGDKCTNKCNKITCSSGECIIGEPKYPTDGDMNPCYEYYCDGDGNWVSGSPIDCRDKLHQENDACTLFSCESGVIKWTDFKSNYDYTKICIPSNICTVTNCEKHFTVDGINEATCNQLGDNFVWSADDQKPNGGVCIEKVAIDGLDENCYSYTCQVKEDSSSDITATRHVCDNYCSVCVPDANGQSKCVTNPNDPCKTEFSDYERPPGCWTRPSCDPTLNDNKGACREQVNLCEEKSDACHIGKCDRNVTFVDNTAQVGMSSCIAEEVLCSLPSHLSSQCYTSQCVLGKGGCVIFVFFDKLNDCGDCSSFPSCDESRLVITAAIGAGVVAAIVVVAVIALSIGLVASKKMYDMISGASETRMDAASENQLYQSAGKGGSNPLFN